MQNHCCTPETNVVCQLYFNKTTKDVDLKSTKKKTIKEKDKPVKL